MTPNAWNEMHAIHEAAHAVVAARLGWFVKRLNFGTSKSLGYTDVRPRPGRRWSRRADVLISLAGHAAEIRLAKLNPRHSRADPYQGDELDLNFVFKILAEDGRADTVFPRFMRALRRVEQMLAEPHTWSAILKVARHLRRFKTMNEDDFAYILLQSGSKK